MGFIATPVYCYIIVSYRCSVKMTSRDTPTMYDADSVSWREDVRTEVM